MSDIANDALVARLTGFVPGLVLRRLAVDPTPISEPTAERYAAAVLFADISNFTALAEKLAGHGQGGAEELAGLLNNTFGLLINIIEAHGGEVTKFAGDALLAIWPVTQKVARGGRAARQALKEMAVRAAQCGLALQSALSEPGTAGPDSIGLQIGIGAGDVYIVHLGGVFDRWEFLLSGSPLSQMTLAKERARPGQVVLSPEVWSLVADKCQGRALDAGFVALGSGAAPTLSDPSGLPNLPPEAVKGLLAYVPAAIQARLVAGHHEWLSELRQLTVVFVKLPSYGTSIKHPYARTLPKAQAVMQAMQTALYRYAGSINKLNVDDKGITLVAAMGLPPLSHEDDAARAVHAALEMQVALQELDRPSAIGITTGLVFCGPIGSERRCEYTMVGNVVNLAARLMQVAERNLATGKPQSGRIKADLLCDEATFQQIVSQSDLGLELAGTLEFEPIAAVQVKGKPEPVRAYRPARKKRSTIALHQANLSRNRRRTVIGRQAEQRLLSDSLGALRVRSQTPSTRLFILEGEAGTGKSMLAQSLLDQAEAMRLFSLTGWGDPLNLTTPYHAWQPVFRKLFELDAVFGDLRQQRNHILGQLPALPGERGFPALALRLSPLLNAVLPLGFPDNKMTASFSKEVRRRTIHLFLLRLLQRAVISGVGRRQPPRLLIMDNGQWLDRASWRLLASLSRQVDKLLVVVLTRPLDEDAMPQTLALNWQRLLSEPNVERRRLPPLTPAETEELVCRQLGVDSLPVEATRILHGKSGGNPFFSQELVRSWQASGRLKLNGRACLVKGDLDSSPIPHLVHKLISGRLDDLSPNQSLALKIASTIGETFTYQDLLARYPLEQDRTELSSALVRLETLGLIYGQREAPEKVTGTDSSPDPAESQRLTYRFSYAFIREAIQNQLLLAQRRIIQNSPSA